MLWTKVAMLRTTEAIDLGCKYVIWEGDALNVILPIQNIIFTHKLIEHIFNETKLILNSFFSEYFVPNIYGVANFVALNVGRWALLCNLEGMIPISFIPNFALGK